MVVVVLQEHVLLCEKSAEFSFFNKDGFKIYNHEVLGKAGTEKGYIKASGQASYSALRIKDHTGDTKFLSTSVGGEIGPSMWGYGGKVRAGVDGRNWSESRS